MSNNFEAIIHGLYCIQTKYTYMYFETLHDELISIY